MKRTTVEIERLKAMTPAEKLAVMHGLIRQAYELKAAGLKALHPDWSDQEVWARTREIVGGGIS